MVSKYTGLNGGTKTSKTARSELDLEQTKEGCIDDADSLQEKNDHWVKDFFSSKLESVVRIKKRIQNSCCVKRNNAAVSQHANTFESSQKRSIVYFIASLIAYLSLVVFIHLYSSVDQKYMCALDNLQFISRAFGYGVALFIAVFSPFFVALIEARVCILAMSGVMMNVVFVVVLIMFCLLDNSNQPTVQNMSNYTCIQGLLRKKFGAVNE